MRVKLEADHALTAPVQARHGAPTSPLCAATPQGVAALQRLAGNAAVAGLMVQRDLIIRDEDEQFTDPVQARKYLENAFIARSKHPPKGDQVIRLEELARTAALGNEIYDVPTLGAALDYIQNGTPINVDRQYVDPSLSPVRGPGPEWGYGMAGRAPTRLEAPQSPRRAFPQAPHAPVEIDVPGMLADREVAIAKERARHPRYRFGKNLFSYSVNANVRITPMAEKTDVAGAAFFGPSGPAEQADASAESDLYQSRLELPPRKPGAKRERIEKPTRDVLQIVHDRNKKHRTLKNTSLYASDRSGSYFANAKGGSIGSLFVHSEVQAAADAHRGAADDIVTELMEEIERKIEDDRPATGGPVEAVVVAVTIAGFSEPNTVCGGACKGALVHVAQLVESKFNAARAEAKPDLRANGIYLRGSADLTISSHVRGRTEFQGLGKGADPAPAAGMPPAKRAKHHHAEEYKAVNAK